MSNEHLIIMHAFTVDAEGEHYLDERVPKGTPVLWTAYERRLPEGSMDDWVFEEGDYERVLREAQAKAEELGVELRIEHHPDEVYL
jgi:hypothetical protein